MIPSLKGNRPPAKETLKDPHPQGDYRGLSQYLETHVRGLTQTLLGMPNPRTSTKETWTFGSKNGSLHVEVAGAKQGRWYDFATDRGGGPIQLVEYVQRSSKEAAWAWANHWAGGGFLRVQQGELVQREELPEKIARVHKMYGFSKLIQGTLAEQYLKEHRKIQGTLPKDVRFLPLAYEPETQTKRPALAVFGRNEKGEITAAQLTYLDPSTADKARDLRVQKRSQGIVKGSFVVLQKEIQGPLYVAEGVETALSLKEGKVKGSIVATLGLFNMKQVPVQRGRRVVICADNDGINPQSAFHTEEIKRLLTDKGAEVHVICPEREGQDFNDVLKEQGIPGVRAYVDTLLERAGPNASQSERRPAEGRSSVDHLAEGSRSAERLDSASPLSIEETQRLSHLLSDFKNNPDPYLRQTLKEDLRAFKHIHTSDSWKHFQSQNPDLSQKIEGFEQTLRQKEKGRGL